MKRENYSEDWADVIRPSILKRDNYHCKKCKVKHRAIGYFDYKKVFVECDDFMIKHAIKLNMKLTKIILQVHHKNQNKKDNDNNNLITLCPRCHFEADREYNKIKRKCIGIIFPTNTKIK